MFAALPYVRGVWWYDLIDDGPDAANAEDRFGLFRQTHALKPAAQVVQSLAPFLKNNHLAWIAESQTGAGLIILKRDSSRAPSVVAWHAHPSPQDVEKSEWRYVVSCNPTLSILRAERNISASEQAITTAPTVFTYRLGHCTRERLPGPK